jgi:hypothetical protein
MEVIRLGFQSLKSHEKLWPSGATLRLRFAQIAAGLKLPTNALDSAKPLSLAGFCPGGATHLITQTESAEVVRRRVRWIWNKVMECYLQEVTSTTYLNEVNTECRRIMLDSFAVFPQLLRLVINLSYAKSRNKSGSDIFRSKRPSCCKAKVSCPMPTAMCLRSCEK